jgi:uncharacterized cupin superfamily protein
MGHTVIRAEDREYHPPLRGDQSRGKAELSPALHAMRANIWRHPAGTRNLRHIEHAQEELFVVLEGTATFLLGDPPERVEAPSGTVVMVETETALQLLNDGDEETVVLAVGAPPEEGRATHLPDVD